MKYFFSLICFFISISVIPQPQLKFEVYSGDYPRINTPVSLETDFFKEAEFDKLVLIETTGNTNEVLPVQVEEGYRTHIWFLLKGATPPDSRRSFLLVVGNPQTGVPEIQIKKSSEGTLLTANEKNILRYNHKEAIPPEGVDPLFRRSAFIHPLWSPDQQILTRIQPPDHYHHYGIWNPWTRTRFQGREIDFWNLGEGQGTVRFKNYISYITGPVFSGFKALQEHVDFTSGRGESVALNEILDIRIWNTDSEIKNWLIDFTSVLNCATDSAVLLHEYRYGGGIGFRATELWGTDNSSVLTSEGKSRDEADATRARWCIICGETQSGAGRSGILFMSSHQNREHPEPLRVWPSETMEGKENVFFMFTPIRHNEWMLEPGINHVLKYRMMVFDGGLSSREAERYWTDFAFPPEVKVISLVR